MLRLLYLDYVTLSIRHLKLPFLASDFELESVKGHVSLQFANLKMHVVLSLPSLSFDNENML